MRDPQVAFFSIRTVDIIGACKYAGLNQADAKERLLFLQKIGIAKRAERTGGNLEFGWVGGHRVSMDAIQARDAAFSKVEMNEEEDSEDHTEEVLVFQLIDSNSFQIAPGWHRPEQA